MPREIIALACGECKRKNYSTMKNKKLHPDRVEHTKYCRWCNKHTPHKESKSAPSADGSKQSAAGKFRPVAQLARASVSKTGGWGFESLQA